MIRPFSFEPPPKHRGRPRTQFGRDEEDREARDCIRRFYRDVLDTFLEADLHPDDPSFLREWLMTETVEACDVSSAKALVGTDRALAAIAARRGHASRARGFVRELVSSLGVVTDTGRRVVASPTDKRLGQVLEEPPKPRRSPVNPGAAFMIAHGVIDGVPWKATLYRVRVKGQRVAMARVRLGRSLLRGTDLLAPDATLPDGRTVRSAVVAWAKDMTRTAAERTLASLFVRRRA